jgi:hypothetical protein
VDARKNVAVGVDDKRGWRRPHRQVVRQIEVLDGVDNHVRNVTAKQCDFFEARFQLCARSAQLRRELQESRFAGGAVVQRDCLARHTDDATLAAPPEQPEHRRNSDETGDNSELHDSTVCVAATARTFRFTVLQRPCAPRI